MSRPASSGRATAGRPARRKDPLRVALFAKRARAARDDRPNVAFGPTPVHSGLLDADGAGRWGMERDFGGRYVPETLMAALEQLESAYDAVRHDPVFWAELRELLAHFAGRPTALYRADRLAEAVRDEAARLAGDGRADATDPGPPPLPQARGPRPHRRPQDQQRAGAGAADAASRQDPGHRRDRRRPARRGDRHRLRAARPAVRRLHGRRGHRAAGPERPPDARPRRRGPLGDVRHGDAQGRGQRGDARLGHQRRDDPLRPRARRWVRTRTRRSCATSSAGSATRRRRRSRRSRGACRISPLACVGGGSNAIGLLARFIGEPTVRLAVVEAAGDGIETGRHAAAILGGTPGILHGSRSLMLQDADGQVTEAHSASAGLDYPGIGPQLAALAEGGRIEVAAATDREAVAAMKTTTRTEGILPALETAHAIAALPELLAGIGGVGGSWPDEVLVLLGFSGRGDKDLAALERFARRRAVAGRPMTPVAVAPADPADAETGTNTTRGARRIAAAFARARAEGRAALIPYVVAGYPDADTSFEIALAAADAGADVLEVGLAVFRPARRRCDAPARVRRRARCGCDVRAIAPAHRADRRGAPGPAAGADGLRQPGHRRRGRRGGREAPGRAPARPG